MIGLLPPPRSPRGDLLPDIEFTLRDGYGSMRIAGRGVASAVTGFTLTSHAGGPARLTLEVPELDIGAGEVKVLLTPAVRECLAALGWTPPAEDV